MPELPSPTEREGHRTTLTLLAIGAAGGLLLAVFGILDAPRAARDALPEGVVARVGDSTIRSDELARLVAGLEQDMREPVSDEMERRVLERMIDEELLVQRAVELGLIEVDRRVRADLTSAMITSIVSDAEEREPSERELRAFLDENAEFFTTPGRLRVRQVFFRAPRAADGQSAPEDTRPARARDRLRAGDDFATVRLELGDAEVSPLPDAKLPALKLREYLGPTALRSAMELGVGEVSEPIRSGTGIHVLQLVEQDPAYTPAFDEIPDQVENEWRRREGDRALRAYLDGLRDEFEVVIALPQP